MKSFLIFAAAIVLSLSTQAQITLENTYDGDILKVARLDDTTEVYYATSDSELVIYNLNHSIYKSIDFQSSFTAGASMIYYVSKFLFDSDNEIEYMRVDYFVGQNGESAAKANLKVFNEDGTELFTADTVLVDRFHFLFGVAPLILNTQEGTKMIIRSAGPSPKETKVYSLSGKLYTTYELPNLEDPNTSFSIYPNPANEFVKVEYTLPEGTERGKLFIYNVGGQLVKSFNVDSRIDHLLLSASDLEPGSYYYTLKTSVGTKKTKKVIVIH